MAALFPENNKLDQLPHSRVLIIILNWNGKADTLDCVKSLKKLKDQKFDILVVDNGSIDNSAAEISRAYPEVNMICLNENLGYVGGNNVGLKYALSRDYAYMLLLNNDTEVSETFLNRLLSIAESNSKIGVLSPVICYFDPREFIWSAGGKVDFKHWQSDMISMGKNIQEYGRTSPYPVDFVTGCALLVKREVVEKVGLLDDRFFAYYEDVEWCVRIRKAGFEVVVVPDSRIWHKVSPQKRASSPIVTYYMTRNRLLFMRLAGSGCRKIIRVALFENIRTVLSWSIKPKWRNKRILRKAVLQALWDAGTGRWGRTSHADL